MPNKPEQAISRAAEAQQRIQRRAYWQHIYHVFDGAFHLDLAEHKAILRMALKWLFWASMVGVLAGSASALFLESLRWATELRLKYPNLLYFLPAIGLALGWIYHAFAGVAARGNNLVIEEVNANRQPIPLKMAPLVFVGTLLTHLFGGSAGREGTAIQMSSSLADWLQRQLHLSPEDRRLMLMAGISAGFASVFGTPIAGFVFGLEVQTMGRIRYEGIWPCLVAALVGDLTTRGYGVEHSHYPVMTDVDIAPMLLIKVIIAGTAFGLTSLAFIELTDAIRHLGRNFVTYSPLRPLIGGFIIIALTGLVGTHDYLGLSLPLIQNSLNGTGVADFAFLLKLLFTAVTLGMGFLGGEVTPLFVIGSTLGYTMGSVLGIDPAFMASIGFIAVFAGATNTPLACILMGVELFGGGSLLYLTIGCFVAYLASGHRSIYATQRISVTKAFGLNIYPEKNIQEIGHHGQGWLPDLPAFASTVGLRPIRVVMSPMPIVASEDTPVDQIVTIMLHEGVRILLVLDQSKKLTGIITDTDLIERGGVPLRLGLLANLVEDERARILSNNYTRLARDIMTAPPISILQTALLQEAAALMRYHRIKRLPVVNQGGHLVGILTRSDILRELSFSVSTPIWTTDDQHKPVPLQWESPISQVSLNEVPTVSPDTSLDGVLEVMLAAAQKRLVVVNDQRQVVGIITDGDLLKRVRPDQYPLTLEALSGHSFAQPVLSQAATIQMAQDVMTMPVITVTPVARIGETLHLILEHRIKRIPVVDDEGRLIGVIGRAELMRRLLG